MGGVQLLPKKEMRDICTYFLNLLFFFIAVVHAHISSLCHEFSLLRVFLSTLNFITAVHILLFSMMSISYFYIKKLFLLKLSGNLMCYIDVVVACSFLHCNLSTHCAELLVFTDPLLVVNKCSLQSY